MLNENVSNYFLPLQQRRSFEKAYDWEDEDEQISKLEEKNLDEGDNDNNELYEKQLMEKYGRKWLHKAAVSLLFHIPFLYIW